MATLFFFACTQPEAGLATYFTPEGALVTRANLVVTRCGPGIALARPPCTDPETKKVPPGLIPRAAQELPFNCQVPDYSTKARFTEHCSPMHLGSTLLRQLLRARPKQHSQLRFNSVHHRLCLHGSGWLNPPWLSGTVACILRLLWLCCDSLSLLGSSAVLPSTTSMACSGRFLRFSFALALVGVHGSRELRVSRSPL